MFDLMVLLAQVPEATTPTGKLIVLVALPIVGWLAEKTYGGFKTLIPAYDKAPAVVHQAAAPLWAALLGWVSAHLGLSVIDSLGGIDGAWINAALTALVQQGIFRWEKSKQPADATKIVIASRASSGGTA